MVYNTRSKNRNSEPPPGVSNGVAGPSGNDNGCTAHPSEAHQAPPVNIISSAPPTADEPNSKSVYFPYLLEAHQAPHVHDDSSAPPGSRDSPPQHPHDTHTSVTTRSIGSTRSSNTIKARKLAAEALHARQLCDITARQHNQQADMAAQQADMAAQQAELERKAADLHLQAELAAIDAKSVRDSVSRDSVRGNDHRNDHASARTDNIRRWLNDVQPNIIPKTTTGGKVPSAATNTARHQSYTKAYNETLDVPSGSGPGRYVHPAILNATHDQTYAPNQNTTDVSPTKIPNNFQPPDGATVNCGHNDLIGIFEAITNKPKKSDIKLPVFDGKSATDWLCFKRIFIDTQSSFTTVENLVRISSSLRGAAREAVYILLVSANDPMEVIDALEMRFGRPEKIVMQEINAVRALPKVGAEGKDLVNFACRVKNCIGIMRLLDQFDYLHSPEIFNSLMTKLSPIIRGKWYEFAASHTGERMSKLEMLSDFLSREVELQTKFGIQDFHSSTASVQLPTERGMHTDQSLPDEKSPNSAVNKTVNKCIFCSKLHNVNKCDKFLALSVNERWQFIKKNKVCHRCLENKSHRFNLCKVKSPCSVGGCTYKHHSLLHNLDNDQNVLAHADLEDTSDSELEIAPKPSIDVKVEKPEPDDYDVEVSAHATAIPPSSSVSRPKSRPLLKVVSVQVTGPQGTVDTHALLDDGCTTTFIDSEITKRVGIEGPSKRVRIDCVGGLSRNCDIQYVDFIIKGRDCTDSYHIHSARSVKNLGINYRASVNREDICKYSYLSDLGDVLCCEEVQPMIIIGVDNWKLTIADSIRAGKDHQPVAVHTALGWVLYGFVSSRTSKVDFLHHAKISETPDDHFSIETAIKDYYKLDSIGIIKKDHRGNSDTHALKILRETVHRLSDGHFEAGLLWRPDVKDVPNNFKLALSRFLSLEKKMQSDVQYANMYRNNIKAILDKKYAEECTAAPIGITWYLPHFGVTHAHKPGKLRVVHDAAAKFRGISLNSLLLPGPDLLQPLLAILMRFRENAIALTADIREMFPQVRIRSADRDAQRFLWRNDPADKIKLYRMSSMMFGACSSPCTALYVKNLNATENKLQYPDAAHATIHDVYMDDYIGSLESVDQAARLARDIVILNRQAGFEMRDWVSNDPRALSLLVTESISQKFNDVILGNDDNVSRVLGLNWQPRNDVIGFSLNLDSKPPAQLSKRDALSHLMRIYDPLGILGPLVSRGRVMFQSIWRKGLSWDDELDQGDQKLWNEWLRDVQLASQLYLPRYYGLRSYNIIHRELHLFCDASELAYAAVAYWRYTYADGTVKLALIGSKSRVTPLKPASIPRLELQAALVAARFASFIHDSHQHKPSKRIFWCDSLNVLSWLCSDARSFKPFVAHRIGEILETTDVKEWRWIPTAENVADDATRHKREVFNQESRWITGPKFLLESEQQWPSSPYLNTASSLEIKPSAQNHCHLISSHHFPTPLTVDPERLSSWGRLLRATARAHKFLHLLKNKDSSKEITAEDLRVAESHILKKSQLDSFPDEIIYLSEKRSLHRKSRLFNLAPYIDNENLLRLGGRINRMQDIGDGVKSPIILDSKHPAVQLLIAHYHVKSAHANSETVVNEMRQTYWIINLRSAVRKVAHDCQLCRLKRAQPFTPSTGDLPPARLAHHRRPFTFVGLDYFGPVQVTVGRRKEKRYVALYTCLVIRAVHLEVVHSLSTDAAIMSLRRFIARRGTPSEIWSDNGTAFVGANRMLRELYGVEINRFAADEKVSWRFIPPSAPFMGGAWERMVRSVKTALKTTLRQRSPSDEVLQTFLLESENLVNTRPLTHVPVDPDCEEALTPMHFILGSSSGRPIPATLTDRDIIGRDGWRRAVRLTDHFWSRWVREYLPTLVPRRGGGSSPNIKEGDLIIVADGQLPRGSWPRGRVIKIYTGPDGVARVADVRTGAGLLRRPLKKLVPQEL